MVTKKFDSNRSKMSKAKLHLQANPRLVVKNFDEDDDDLCATDGGAGEASIGAGIEDTEALVEDADGVVHVGRVVLSVVALASRKASLKIWACGDDTIVSL